MFDCTYSTQFFFVTELTQRGWHTFKKKVPTNISLSKIWIQTTIKMQLRFHFELHLKTVRTECLSSHNDRYWDICSNYFVSERRMEKIQMVLEMLVHLPLNHLTWLLSHCIGYLSESPLNPLEGALYSTLHHTFNSWPIRLTTRCWEEWSQLYVVY